MYNLTNGHAPFFIQNGAPSYSFYFKADGTVGIGTNAPAYKLDVNGNALAVGPKTGSSGNGGAVRFRDDTAAEHWLLGLPSSGGGTLFRITDLANSHDVVTVESGTPASTLALKSTGNVGIGTTSPAAKLDVAGGINASGSIVIGGTATKQTSGGPELLSFQNSDPDHVAFAGFEPADTNFRFGASIRGFVEWGAGGTADQDVALFRTGLGGGLAVQSFNSTFSKHALSVQRPTAIGTEVDFLRVSTMENLLEMLGSLVVTGTAFTAAGTVTVNAGNLNTVNGTNTLFTQQVTVGDKITVDTGGSAETRIVASITNDTQLTVSSPFSTAHSNKNMTITKQQLVQVNGSAGGVNLFMSDGGSVGLGTGSPTDTLDVVGGVVSKRFSPNRGTALVSADFSLSSGWGVSPTVSVGANSDDQRGRITVTPGTGALGANPTITLTFKDGAWAVAPFALTKMEGGTGALSTLTETTSTTTLVITFVGTPVANKTYIICWLILG